MFVMFMPNSEQLTTAHYFMIEKCVSVQKISYEKCEDVCEYSYEKCE